MKILIAGLGGIGQRHIRNLRALLGSSVEILAYRTRRLAHVITPALQADPALDVEKEYGIQVFSTLEAALSEGPQIALVCNPTSLHVPVALACIRAGCDVFLEKPVFCSLEGVPELMAAAGEGNRVVMVGYQLRFHPCLRRLQEIVREGMLGHLLSVRATVGEYLPGWHPYEDYRQMYASRASLGGGVILSQIHEFDYFYALFGRPRSLFSLGGHWSSLEINVEDVASTLIEFHTDGRPLPVHLHQDYLQRPASRSCEVIGDRGKVIMDLRFGLAYPLRQPGRSSGVARLGKFRPQSTVPGRDATFPGMRGEPGETRSGPGGWPLELENGFGGERIDCATACCGVVPGGYLCWKRCYLA